MTQFEIELNQALAALEWSASGEWSARITPVHARALLRELRELKKLRGKAVPERLVRDVAAYAPMTREEIELRASLPPVPPPVPPVDEDPDDIGGHPA